MSSTPWTLDGCIRLSAPASFVCSQCSYKNGPNLQVMKSENILQCTSFRDLIPGKMPGSIKEGE